MKVRLIAGVQCQPYRIYTIYHAALLSSNNSVARCINGTVRLMIGDDYEYYMGDIDNGDDYYFKDALTRGRVEICIDGSYGTVCADSWNDIDASIVCSELGYSRFGKIM